MSGVHGLSGRHVRGRLLAAAVRESGMEQAAVAGLQRVCGAWLVMWSPWRRTYTAFACFTREPVIVDEADKDAFLAHVRQVELGQHDLQRKN